MSSKNTKKESAPTPVANGAASAAASGKTRMGVVLRESLGGNKSSSKSADLLALTDLYTVWTKKMACLIDSIKQHHAAMMQLETTRVSVRSYILLYIFMDRKKESHYRERDSFERSFARKLTLTLLCIILFSCLNINRW